MKIVSRGFKGHHQSLTVPPPALPVLLFQFKKTQLDLRLLSLKHPLT